MFSIFSVHLPLPKYSLHRKLPPLQSLPPSQSPPLPSTAFFPLIPHPTAPFLHKHFLPYPPSSLHITFPPSFHRAVLLYTQFFTLSSLQLTLPPLHFPSTLLSFHPSRSPHDLSSTLLILQSSLPSPPHPLATVPTFHSISASPCLPRKDHHAPLSRSYNARPVRI